MAITILILAANPKDTPRLRLDEEVREIDHGLQRSQKRNEFILRSLWATRPEDVRRAMLDFKPNIVHFCGHGEGEDGIAFEDEIGMTRIVNAEALAGLFRLFANEVGCVFLNACYSDTQADAISQYIKYVIGMKKGISDVAAIEFAVAFYDALGAGATVEFAYELAKNAIQWKDISEYLTPILKVRPETVTNSLSSQRDNIGSSMGAIAKGAAGAAVGATVGSFLFPGIGTVVGALLGGYIGTPEKSKEEKNIIENTDE